MLVAGGHEKVLRSRSSWIAGDTVGRGGFWTAYLRSLEAFGPQDMLELHTSQEPLHNSKEGRGWGKGTFCQVWQRTFYLTWRGQKGLGGLGGCITVTQQPPGPNWRLVPASPYGPLSPRPPQLGEGRRYRGA